MENTQCKKLDTKSFDNFFSNKEIFIKKYDEINNDYNRIVSTLLENWKGLGADAFKKDASDIKTNITSIYDILQNMFNTLTDCYEVFKECDKSLGDFNKNPNQEG